MTDNYFERFIQWQNYVHYLLLTLGLFIWHALNTTAVLEHKYVSAIVGVDKWLAFSEMFLWYLLGLLIVDSIVHAIFWFLPEKCGQWRD